MAVARQPALLSPDRYTLRADLCYLLSIGTTNPAAGGTVNVNYKVRVDGTTWNKPCVVGDVYRVDGKYIEALWLDPAALTINVAASVELDVGLELLVNNINTPAPLTVGNIASFGPSVVAAATAETVEATMGTLIPGQVVHYELEGSAISAADAGALIWIALKGATSGVYFAAARANPVYGSFVVESAEVVQLVVKNAGASGYQMHGFAEARLGSSG